MKLRLLLLGILAFHSGKVFAEGRCPPGYYPTGSAEAGWFGCAPMGPEPGADDTEDDSASRTDMTEQPRIQGHAEPAWGALVWDPEMLIADYKNSLYFGLAMGKRSKLAAIDHAMSQCESDGGKKCQVQVTITNACLGMAGAVNQLVWAVEHHDGKSILDSSERAGEKALAKCISKGYEKCEIVYTDCSISNWVSN